MRKSIQTRGISVLFNAILTPSVCEVRELVDGLLDDILGSLDVVSRVEKPGHLARTRQVILTLVGS